MTRDSLRHLFPFKISAHTYATPVFAIPLLRGRPYVFSIRMIAANRALEAKKMSWAPVYAFVKRIPRGRVITYGALAKALRLRGGARSAGRAMAASPSGKGIPWHRVVGDRGKLLIPEPY